jgi:hypothetical protein
MKKAEHENGKPEKRARKLCKLTVISKMCTDLSRIVWMRFPNHQNENVAPNLLLLLTMAQNSIILCTNIEIVWRLGKAF